MTVQQIAASIKPKIGLCVRLRGEPGIWQVISRAQGSEWWLSPVDDAARNAPAKPAPLGSFRAAASRDMQSRSFRGPFT